MLKPPTECTGRPSYRHRANSHFRLARLGMQRPDASLPSLSELGQSDTGARTTAFDRQIHDVAYTATDAVLRRLTQDCIRPDTPALTVLSPGEALRAAPHTAGAEPELAAAVCGPRVPPAHPGVRLL